MITKIFVIISVILLAISFILLILGAVFASEKLLITSACISLFVWFSELIIEPIRDLKEGNE